MLFPDFPFPDDAPSFVHHTAVRKYLEDYASHYNLEQYIRFETKVQCVKPILDTGSVNLTDTRWNVQYQQLGCHVEEEEFDAVVVCNGHYSVPNHPDIIGIENYKGKTIHSHFYRDPKKYVNFKNIVVFGFGPSGRDIALDLSTVCEKVTISHHGERTRSELPENCFESYGISHITKNGDFITSSSAVMSDVDLLVVCTGYLYDFPFLDDGIDLKMSVERRTMHNLYKHIFYIDKPSLSFVGIPLQTLPFPIMHQQCGYIAAVLGGLKSLPSVEEMHADTLQEIEERLAIPEPARYFHIFDPRQFEYTDMLSSLSGLPNNPKILEKLYKYTGIFRSSNIILYKKMEFKKINDEEFEVVKSIDECRDEVGI